MKKAFVAIAAAAVAGAAAAALGPVELCAGDVASGWGRAVAVSAVSTNLSGTLTVKRVTPLSLAWTETQLVTNRSYTSAQGWEFASNVVTVAVEGGVTNLLTNAVYRAVTLTVTNEHVREVRTVRTAKMAVTNGICSLTLSGGYAETNLTGVTLFPGDYLAVGGTALGCGRGHIIIER